MLQDLVRFQGITFNIIRGIYWDQGRNTGIKTAIETMYEERKRLKAIGNKGEKAYKLTMNAASFGKHAEKPHNTVIKFFDNYQDFLIFTAANYEQIERATFFPNSKKILCKYRKTLDDHQNSSHIASEILSYSKRIMNRVMYLAEDNNIPIFYTDTDSIHLNEGDIQRLSEIFEAKFGTPLMSKKLGEFSTEFDVSEKDISNHSVGQTEIEGAYCYSEEFIGVGKKAYYDRIVARDEEGKYYRKEIYKLKGIPKTAIEHTAKKEFEGSIRSIYHALVEGKAVEFDMLEGGARVRFKKHKNLKTETIGTFVRKVVFNSTDLVKDPADNTVI